MLTPLFPTNWLIVYKAVWVNEYKWFRGLWQILQEQLSVSTGLISFILESKKPQETRSGKQSSGDALISPFFSKMTLKPWAL